MNPMAPLLDGIAVSHARRLGALAPAKGLPRHWWDSPELSAIFFNAPEDLRRTMATEYTAAYDRAEEGN